MLKLLNQFFDKIYIITIDRNKNRQQYIKHEFKTLDFSFFKGYDGQKLNIDQLEKENIYDKEAFIEKRWNHTEPSLNKVGCALSHLSVCKDIVNSNHNNALILEDDIEVVENNLNILKDSLQELPKNWELFYLGYHQNEVMPFLFKLKLLTYYRLYNHFVNYKYNIRELRCHFPRPFSDNLKYAGWHYGGYAYALSKSGAEKYIRLQTPIAQENDSTLGKLCYKELVNAFIIKDEIVVPNSTIESSIGSSVKDKAIKK